MLLEEKPLCLLVFLIRLLYECLSSNFCAVLFKRRLLIILIFSVLFDNFLFFALLEKAFDGPLGMFPFFGVSCDVRRLFTFYI